MNICFVNTFLSLSMKTLPIGLEILSHILNEKSKHNSMVIDFNYLNRTLFKENIYSEENYNTIVEYILKSDTDVVSFYTLCDSYHISLVVAKELKKRKQSLKIIFAGPHASMLATRTLEEFDFIDLVAIGEGESYIIDLMDGIEKKDLTKVPSICYRDSSGSIMKNKECELIENLDDLPIIPYKDEKKIADIVPFQIEVGRGCPFNCTYCSTKTFWKRNFRIKSVDRIIEEVKFYRDNYNKDTFDFVHDLFTANRQFIEDFCEKVIKSDLKITWKCSSRADVLDEDLIELMAKAGCYSIYVGIETGSQRMQYEVKKNLDLIKTREIIDLIKKNDMGVLASVIYGFPTETVDDLKQTIEFIRYMMEEQLVDNCTLNLCAIVPGTELFNSYHHKLVFDDEKNSYSLGAVNVSRHKELIKKYPEFFSEFYSYENEVTLTYPKLDIFMNILYPSMLYYLPETFYYILEEYNDDLLELYFNTQNIIPSIENLINELFLEKIEFITLRIKSILLLEDLINIMPDTIKKSYKNEISNLN
ncbi:B12-binding domain-containing radical SAM protein [Clostridium oceanicum]